MSAEANSQFDAAENSAHERHEMASGEAASLRNRRRARRPRLPRWLGGAVLAILSLAAVASVYLWWDRSRIYVSTDNAYVVGNITPASAEIGGDVVALYTDDNRLVQAGSPLAQLDPVPYQIAVEQARADLSQTQADARAADLTVGLTLEDRSSLHQGAQAKVSEYEHLLRSARLDMTNKQQLLEKDRRVLDALKAQEPGAHAMLQNAQAYQERFSRLADRGQVAIQAHEDKEAAYQDSKAKLESLQSSIAAAERQMEADRILLDEAEVKIQQSSQALEQTKAALGQAHASLIQPQIATATAESQKNKVAQAEAKLHQARLLLGYTLVRATQCGIVSRRTLQLGQAIAARQPFLSIVPLDPHNVWVVANLREDQMIRVRVGQPATIHVDAIPDPTFTGYVESVAGGTGSVFSLFPPDNATGNFTRVVQRLPVRLRFDDRQEWTNRIRPGMSVVVTIDTSGPVRQDSQEW